MKRLFTLAALLICPLAHATGYTATTTGNWSNAATWGGAGVPGVGDTAACSTAITVTVATSTTVGTSPASGNVVTFTGSCVLAISTGQTLTALGGTLVAKLQGSADASLKFDSTSAASPTSTPYTYTGFTFTTDVTNPATPTHKFTITANPAGTNWQWVNGTAGSGTSGVVNMKFQYMGQPIAFTGNTTLNSQTISSPSSTAGLVLGTTIAGNGIPQGSLIQTISPLTISLSPGATQTATGVSLLAAAPGFIYTPGGSHGTLTIGGVGTPVIFDHTCGIDFATGFTNADGWNWESVSFQNTYLGCAPWFADTGFGLPSGTRSMNNVVFDLPIVMETHGATYNHSIFMSNWINPNAFVNGTDYALVENSFIAVSWITSGVAWNGNNGLSITDVTLTNDIVIGDPAINLATGTPIPQTPAATGTATSATNGTITSTLTDSSKSFTTNQFATGATTNYVAITGGTGKGEANTILSNTATVITVIQKWDVTPDATSTYAIYLGVGNPHWTNGNSSLPQGTVAPPYTGNIFQLTTGSDNNGDGFHATYALKGAGCNNWHGTWSNSTAYLQFSSVVQSGIYYRSTTSTTGNNPSTDGGAHWTVVSTVAGLTANCGVWEFSNNIFNANVAADNSGTLLSAGLGLFILKHNTVFTGAQSMVAYNEQSTPTAPNTLNSPQQFSAVQDNLAWADPTRTYVLANAGTSVSVLGPWNMVDITSPGGPSMSDLADPGALTCFSGGTSSCIDYNGAYGLNSPGWCFNPSGNNQPTSSPYFNVLCTTAVGSHDVSGNPGFLRPFPSPQSWLRSLGIDATNFDPVIVEADVYACLMKLNDPSGFNASCTVANLYNYLHQSVNFSNASYHNAAADGTDIGVGQFIPPAAGANVLGSGKIVVSGSVVIQ